ncbi:MAG: type II secretion system F family protein [Selenomonadaceae bacterium]|nr:type II secretion system F family protein [Selenomonadaceae bacterium]
MRFLLAAFCAVLTFIIVALIVLFVKRSQSVNVFHRLRRHNVVDKTGKAKENEPLVQRAYKFIKQASKPFSAWNAARNLDFKLKQAGIPLYGAEFIVVLVISAVATTFLVYIVTLNLMFAPFVGAMAPMFILVWLSFLVRRRRNSFTEQLGDCLTTVANALRAGYSFQQAMDVVAKEMEPPISVEFERVMTDIAMGVSLENALDQMNTRVGSSDFDLVVTAVLIQREVGGNLAQILDTISETISDRIRMKREINALTAQGRLSSWVLICLPFAMAVFCWMFNREQMQVFIDEQMGHYALAFALLMELIGYIVIQRIVDIEI